MNKEPAMATKKKGHGTHYGLDRRCRPDKEKEFNRWYNEEHLASALENTRLLDRGAAYEAVKGGPGSISPSTSSRTSPCSSPTPTRRFPEQSDGVDKLARRTSSAPASSATLHADPSQDTDAPWWPRSDMAPALQLAGWTFPRRSTRTSTPVQHDLYSGTTEKVLGVIRGRRFRAGDGHPDLSDFYESRTQGLRERGVDRPAGHRRRRRPAHPSPHAPPQGSPGVYVQDFQL